MIYNIYVYLLNENEASDVWEMQIKQCLEGIYVIKIYKMLSN
jgi:hypothetical protein